MPQSTPAHYNLALPDQAATAALAARLAPLVVPGDVLALEGPLGVGKTTFARALLDALARAQGQEPEEVPSPTFTLVQTYERAPAPVWHLDLYRLEKPEEVYELGLEEALGAAILLIEWPERLGSLLPEERLELIFDFAEEEGARRLELVGHQAWAGRLTALGAMGEA
ncbi:MAG: tRNA (adenosine(37)-N6)-threonylcarbamoyltransferase complex ATPase subunit type 1 TsaE [Kiloniellales bacterium]